MGNKILYGNMRYNIENHNSYTKIHKSNTGRYTFDEVRDIINFDDWYVYKMSKKFRRIEEDEYEECMGMFLYKYNIDKEVEWLNQFRVFYLNKPPHKEMMKIKMIDEI